MEHFNFYAKVKHMTMWIAQKLYALWRIWIAMNAFLLKRYKDELLSFHFDFFAGDGLPLTKCLWPTIGFNGGRFGTNAALDVAPTLDDVSIITSDSPLSKSPASFFLKYSFSEYFVNCNGLLCPIGDGP